MPLGRQIRSSWAIEAADGDRAEAQVIAGSQLIIHAVDQALSGHTPIVRAMKVAIDAGGCASAGDSASELGRLAIEKRWVVKHDDDRPGTIGQLLPSGQCQIEPHKLALIDHLV